MDIDRSILHEEIISRLPTSKIIINDALSPSEYKQYQSLKPTAKSLGFAFVWHSGGKFLVRWKNNQKAYIFNSVTDLNTIRDLYTITKTSTQLLTQIRDTINTDNNSRNTGQNNSRQE